MKAADVSRLCRQLNPPSLLFVQVMPGGDYSSITTTRDSVCRRKPRVMQVLEKPWTGEALAQSLEHVDNLHLKAV